MAFLGAKAAVLEEQLMSAAGNRQRGIIATRFLESCITAAPHPVIAEALRRIHQSKGMISMDMLAREFPFSQRQFERVFKAANGLTPKLYARILRFEHTLHKYRTGDPLTSVALQAGYFDQAHFIHDFKEFTGMAPATYFNAIAVLPPIQDTMSKIYNSR